MRYLRQSTAATIVIGPFLDKTDAVTAKTALADQSSVGRLVKNGTGGTITVASWAQDAGGHYLVGVSAAHTDTIGRLRLEFTDPASYLPVWEDFSVLAAAVYDVLFGTVAPSTHTAATVQALVAAGVVAGVTAKVTATLDATDVTGFLPATAQSVSAGAVTAIQAGLSTYAGGDTAGTTTLLARIPGTVQPQTGDSFARIGAAGAGLTALALETTVQGIAAVDASILAVAARLDATLESSAGSYRYTAAALAQAPTGSGGVAAPTVAQIVAGIRAIQPTSRDVTPVTAPTFDDCLIAAFCGPPPRGPIIGNTWTILQPDKVSTFRTVILDDPDAPTRID